MKTKKPAGEGKTIGLDLGDRRHAVCVLDEAGEIVAEEAIANSREVLTAFAARYPGATFVMETGTHSLWVSRHLAALGHPVIVANARKLRAICSSVCPPAWAPDLLTLRFAPGHAWPRDHLRAFALRRRATPSEMSRLRTAMAHY